MPFQSPGLNQAWERKKERQGLSRPGMGEHVLGLLAGLLVPEIETAISRATQGWTRNPIDMMADLLPDDPTMGMPMPGGFATTINDLKAIYPVLRKTSGGVPFVPIKETTQTLGHPIADVHGALREAERQGRLDLLAHSFTHPVSSEDLKFFLSKPHEEEAAWWVPRQTFFDDMPSDTRNAVPFQSVSWERRGGPARLAAETEMAKQVPAEPLPGSIVDRIKSLVRYKERGDSPPNELLAIIQPFYENNEIPQDLLEIYKPWAEQGKKALDEHWGR